MDTIKYDPKELENEYRDGGIIGVCEKYDIPAKTVYRLLDRHGIARNQPKKSRRYVADDGGDVA